MATFPSEEEKIFALGEEMSAGFKDNTDTYPAPPVDPATLDGALATFSAKRAAAVAAQAKAAEATEEKQAALQDLADKMKTDLRYAEQAVAFDDTKLKLIGWGGLKEKTPLAAPGRARDLVIMEEGDGTIRLAWKKPADGGKTSAYEVRCRERSSNGPYKIAGMSMTTEITLTDQGRGKELEYVVLAKNKAGDGPVSNVVVAVL
uniref:Fibronectin type III domain-containing protein n=1 Tax=Candidatus Kentrum sp. UNK TaxID=2126344 RepID=A0A451B538_9GAMM|nr:MAG: Fibronectin type III domain-containing protein [Candidatus Kentron sp. UNK]VFK73386.1 MAG: Fibronectin type III domain-containing protein [Candidatus Kentron sp. UNK]